VRPGFEPSTSWFLVRFISAVPRWELPALHFFSIHLVMHSWVCAQVSTSLRLSSDKMKSGEHVCLHIYKTYTKPLSCPYHILRFGFRLVYFQFQSLEVLKNTIFPSRSYHRELHGLKQRFCTLESELCKLQEALKVSIIKWKTNPGLDKEGEDYPSSESQCTFTRSGCRLVPVLGMFALRSSP